MYNSLGKHITCKKTEVADLWLWTPAISDVTLWGLILNLLHTHKPELTDFQKLIPN